MLFHLPVNAENEFEAYDRCFVCEKDLRQRRPHPEYIEVQV